MTVDFMGAMPSPATTCSREAGTLNRGRGHVRASREHATHIFNGHQYLDKRTVIGYTRGHESLFGISNYADLIGIAAVLRRARSLTLYAAGRAARSCLILSACAKRPRIKRSGVLSLVLSLLGPPLGQIYRSVRSQKDRATLVFPRKTRIGRDFQDGILGLKNRVSKNGPKSPKTQRTPAGPK